MLRDDPSLSTSWIGRDCRTLSLPNSMKIHRFTSCTVEKYKWRWRWVQLLDVAAEDATDPPDVEEGVALSLERIQRAANREEGGEAST